MTLFLIWCNFQLTKRCIYLGAIGCAKSHILYIDASLKFHEGETNLVALQFAPAICLQWIRSEPVHKPCSCVCHVNTLFHRCHCVDMPASHISLIRMSRVRLQALPCVGGETTVTVAVNSGVFSLRGYVVCQMPQVVTLGF